MKRFCFLFLSIALVSGTALAAAIYDVTALPYDADNTGGDDASSAVLDAYNDALDDFDEGVHLYFPAGTYRMDREIHIDPSHCSANNRKSFGLTVTGDGSGQTTIIVNNNDGFLWLDINNNLNLNRLNVEGLKIVANKGVVDYAIKHTMPKIGSNTRNVMIRDVVITGGDGKGFYTGIDLYGSWWPYIGHVSVTGYTSTEHQFWMQTGVKMIDVYSPFMNDVSITNAYRAIDYEKNGSYLTNVEDCGFSGLSTYNVQKGVKCTMEPDSDHDEVGFHVADSEIIYNLVGLELYGIRQGFINNNVLNCKNTSGYSYDIRFDNNNSTFVVDDNAFQNPYDLQGPRRGLRFASTCNNNLICGNWFNVDRIAIENYTTESGQRNYSADNVFEIAAKPYEDPYSHLEPLDDHAIHGFAYWHMDTKPGGVVADATEGGSNELIINGASLGSGVYYGSMRFDGSNDYGVSARNWDGSHSVHVDCWVNLDKVAGYQFITSVPNVWRVNTVGSSMSFRWKDQSGNWEDALTVSGLSAGTWYHVTAQVSDSANLAVLNVHGVGMVSRSLGGDYLRTVTWEKVYVGKLDSGYWLDGRVDELKITTTPQQ